MLKRKIRISGTSLITQALGMFNYAIDLLEEGRVRCNQRRDEIAQQKATLNNEDSQLVAAVTQAETAIVNLKQLLGQSTPTKTSPSES